MSIQRIDKYTETNKFRDVYSDFPCDFTPHPNTQDLTRITNEDAIKRSIRNLLSTNQYERLFQPTKGSNIRKILFENISDEASRLLQKYITETLENYEKRIKIINVTVDADELNNRYLVNIFFYIINITEPVVFSLPLYRIR